MDSVTVTANRALNVRVHVFLHELYKWFVKIDWVSVSVIPQRFGSNHFHNPKPVKTH
jgi:hypothetical protein